MLISLGGMKHCFNTLLRDFTLFHFIVMNNLFMFLCNIPSLDFGTKPNEIDLKHVNFLFFDLL